MSTSPTDPRPLPVGVTEGQQFITNHLRIFRSGDPVANGLGGPVNFSSEVANAQPRNLFDHIPEQYRELGLRRYRCAYFFNDHYTLSIPNLVVYVKSESQNANSHIAFSFGTSGINGTEQTIASQFNDPVGVTWNSAQERAEALFLAEPLKPRQWKAFWIREILDFDAQSTVHNYFAIRCEAKDPIAVSPLPDFNMCFVGNMGCNSFHFGKIFEKIKARNPTTLVTLGNNSYRDTADCWLQLISPLRGRIKMAFGAYDWYKLQYADKIDDDPYPRIPPDWFWPTPEQPCSHARYEDADNQSFVEVSEKNIDEDDPDSEKVWRVEVFDKETPEGGGDLTRGDIEESWDFGKNELNAKTFANWLKTCEFFTNDVDRDRFNEAIQNQYRTFFGLASFEGFQSFYAGNCHFLILNTNAVPVGHTEDSPQYIYAKEQLRRALDNAYVEYRIVIAYRPGFTAPNGTLRASGDQVLRDGYEGPIQRFNEIYKPLFEEFKVTMYINGNVANYQRTGILKFDSGNWNTPTEQGIGTGPAYKMKDRSLDGSGIIYVTVGTGGVDNGRITRNQTLPSWIKKEVIDHGYLVMNSIGNGMTLEFRFYDLNDNLLDFFSIGVG
jgi:hypothetical protein